MSIRHKEWREFTPTGSDSPHSRYGNVYYHFHTECVWLRCSWFQPASLEVPADLYGEIDKTHKTRLRTNFGIEI